MILPCPRSRVAMGIDTSSITRKTQPDSRARIIALCRTPDKVTHAYCRRKGQGKTVGLRGICTVQLHSRLHLRDFCRTHPIE
jgi:hypothetical protein